MRYDMRVTRATMFVAVLLAVAMVGVPLLPGNGEKLEATGNVAAADIDRLFTIGTVGLSVSTLNPFTYTMADEYMAIWPCMSTLLTYDENMNRIGDLAEKWTMSPDGLTWTFYLVNNAYFTDPKNPSSTAHPVTADDVIYTYGLIQNYTSNLHFYFPGVTDGTPPTIQHMSKLGTYTLSITLRVPYAPFVGALASIPIVPMYYWKPLVDRWGSLTKITDVLPIGSGPWYYALGGLPTTGEVVLKRSPVWFQEANRGWQLHVDTLKIKDLSDPATAWLELKLGNIDTMMGVPPSIYVNELPGTPNVIGFAQSTGFVYEFNLNQMSTTMRDQLVAAGYNNFKTGTNNQLLLDPVIKQAMAMCVNKEGFISNVLEGLGTVADSLVPDVNPWHYTYGTAPGETPIEFNPAAARSLLWANGWRFDAAGREVSETSTQVPLYGYVEGVLTPLSFRFYTLSDMPEWATGATLLKEWAAQAGIYLGLEIKSVNQMNSIWWAADYDVWLWDWMFTPLSDPSTDILSVLTTMEIGSWSDVYYSNATYDSLYNRSMQAMDPVARRTLTDQMQRMAYEDMSCQCVAYRKELYAVSTMRWVNYGDWSTNFMLMPDQGFPYLYMRISPNGVGELNKNLAPVITSLADSFEGIKNNDIVFTGAATDTSNLNYQWYWGDGTKSGWLSSPSATHRYASDGVFDVYFAAKEVDNTDDYYISWKKTTVTVIDPSNSAPTSLSISFTPGSPDTGDVVTFTGSAVDADGDTLYFSWNFGDTYTGIGPVVTHQYITPGTYTVVMSVTDNHIGTEPRPVTTSRLIAVTENRPPTIDVPDYAGIWWKQSYTFTVTASDLDGDLLRYTWYWGDGSFSVTDAPSASHTYSTKGIKTLTVYADDLTGLQRHNVSDTGQVQVIGANKDPLITAWSVSKTNPYSGESVLFTAAGKDQDGDPLTFTLAFGDGTRAVRTASPKPNEVVAFEVPKVYASGGTFTAYLYLSDGVANISSSPIVMNVVPNYAPILTPLVDVAGVVGTPMTFTADAFDPDMDTLKYTWDFGDGTPMVVGDYSVTHTYTAGGMYVYCVYVDDGHGHNVSSAAIVHVRVSFTLNLLKGWNLVTVPLVNHGYTARTLGLVLGDEVVSWSPTSQSYDKVFIVGISPPALDFALNPQEGYWIYAGSARTIVLYGDEPTDIQLRYIDVPEAGGWAIVGIPSLNTTVKASNLAESYSGGVSLVAAYDAALGTYKTYIPGLPLPDFYLSPGMGVWLWCLGDGVLTYAP
ncbi:MAG: PKD domain-containing protein [Phycisphaerae bacterium]